MTYLIVMFTFAFVFMCLMVYFFIFLISNFVFAFKEWKVKRRYDNEVLKELAVLPLKHREEKMQKWYVLVAIIFCGLIWMPGFVTLWQVNEMNIPEANQDIVNVNPIIKPTPTTTISEKYGIPEPYYINAEKGTKNISELREALKGIRYPNKYYSDCSNKASYCEWFLENRGFDVRLCGNLSWGHAWASCSIDGHNVNIECIPPVRITNSDSYNRPEVVYQNIYDALKGQYPFEWVWW